MNYRHAYHAGNFADVLKHTALVAVLLHLRKKDAPFAAIDTHAGRGLYDLSAGEAEKTGEAADGIARLADIRPGGEPLATYLDSVRGFGEGHYPGSPLIMARLLRPQDRMVAVEKHAEEHEALAASLKPFRKAQTMWGDGYERLPALLPPPERRAVVLLDPPFEISDEFSMIAECFGKAFRRFATGVYLIWFPVKAKGDANALAGELLARGAARLLRMELNVGPRDDGRLGETGLLVVNPPFGFDAAMGEVLAALATPLGRDGPAKWRVEWLAGEG